MPMDKHITPDADLAEYLMARDKRDLKQHPRSPVICTPRTAKDIDLSGIWAMTPEQIDEACANWRAS